MSDKKVYVLFEHDSYNYCGVSGVFETKDVAEKARDYYTHTGRDEINNYFVKEFNVEKSLDSYLNIK